MAKTKPLGLAFEVFPCNNLQTLASGLADDAAPPAPTSQPVLVVSSALMPAFNVLSPKMGYAYSHQSCR